MKQIATTIFDLGKVIVYMAAGAAGVLMFVFAAVTTNNW